MITKRSRLRKAIAKHPPHVIDDKAGSAMIALSMLTLGASFSHPVLFWACLSLAPLPFAVLIFSSRISRWARRGDE